ncbi:MAG: DinB family protein [Gemmatimonadota bacterium]|nr:DinB family protein [Gemmatimonadota bacterium]
MTTPCYRIEPVRGYTPTIGRLVGMLAYARKTTMAAVEGLSVEDLDHLHDDKSNSIGALLAHMAVVERGYHVLIFEERQATPPELAACEPALTLGDEGRRHLRGKPLEQYLNDLGEARRATLEALATRDDDWLERPLVAAPPLNAHWALFHIAEDEISHRGQIRWLRARLPR